MADERAGDMRKESMPGVVKGGIALTVIVFAAFLYFAYVKNAFGLPANEIGDTVAGFSSILAFMWITITVYLQTVELRYQRHEIKVANIERSQQTVEFKGWRDAAESQLALLRQNQALLFGEFVKRAEDEAVHGVASHICHACLPTLLKSAALREQLHIDPDKLREWTIMADGGRANEALIQIGSHLGAYGPKGSETQALLGAVSALESIREQIDVLATLFVAYYGAVHMAGRHHRPRYDIGVHMAETGFDWLLEHRQSLPDGLERFGAQLKKKQDELEAMKSDIYAPRV